MAMTKGQEAFIDQKTRSLMPRLADHCIRGGRIPDLPTLNPRDPADKKRLELAQKLGLHKLYFDYAVTMKWIGKKVSNGHRDLTGGYAVAASFLRR
jgi:hypothetical protein